MNKQFQYQIIILGSCSKNKGNLEKTIKSTVSELGIIESAFSIISEENFESEFKDNQPTYVLYFGDLNGTFKNLGEIELLLKKGISILPLFHKSFSDEIPKILENQNGLNYTPSKNQEIVNLALESFGRLRNTRKVFISYRRNESTSVAIQLYEALERHNFDVFLDTHSIKKGEEFQDELWHRMTDCDVIVLLNTPGFLDSKWCKEEIAEANTKKIGLVQLVWPNHKLGATNEISIPILLTENNFENRIYNQSDNSKLINSIVKNVIQKVESLRARTLVSRQETLISEFLKAGKRQNKTLHVQPSKYITQTIKGQKRRIFIPSVGIPQSINCHQTEDIKDEIKDHQVDEIHLIYDDFRIRDKWLNHLDWLNKFLEIKTIKQQEFDSWLKNN